MWEISVLWGSRTLILPIFTPIAEKVVFAFLKKGKKIRMERVHLLRWQKSSFLSQRYF
jgi:hypothetical protein